MQRLISFNISTHIGRYYKLIYLWNIWPEGSWTSRVWDFVTKINCWKSFVVVVRGRNDSYKNQSSANWTRASRVPYTSTYVLISHLGETKVLTALCNLTKSQVLQTQVNEKQSFTIYSKNCFGLIHFPVNLDLFRHFILFYLHAGNRDCKP